MTTGQYSAFLFSIFGLVVACAGPAYAYIGFGPGLTMVGSFFSLVIAVIAVLAMVLLLPLRMLLKKRKARKTELTKDAGSDTTPSA